MTSNRTVMAASPREFGEARHQLCERGYVKLKGLLRGSLLEHIQHAIGRATFYRRVHDRIGVELCAEAGAASGVLEFLTNDQALRNAIADLGGCRSIGCFEGRIYRIVPGTEHHDSWHSDVGDDRLLALSINLGVERFEGGELQMRRADSPALLGEVENRTPGDAVLF